jgi:phage baseplate assembly protein W
LAQKESDVADAVDQTFLGRGWAFPPRLDGSGDVALVAARTDIEQSIRIILETAPGERVMRPDFGVGLRQMVFAPLSAATLSVVQFRVEQALVTWEARIDVQQVNVQTDPGFHGVLLIEVRYRIRETNTFYNFVYPFYLTEGRTA